MSLNDGMVFNPRPQHHCKIQVPNPRPHGVFLCGCRRAYYVSRIDAVGLPRWRKVRWYHRRAKRVLADHGLRVAK